MDVIPATPVDIAQFKVAAARRYKEKGIPPKLASMLFDRQLKKCAAELGVAVPAPKAAPKVASVRVNAIADGLRTQLGLKPSK